MKHALSSIIVIVVATLLASSCQSRKIQSFHSTIELFPMQQTTMVDELVSWIDTISLTPITDARYFSMPISKMLIDSIGNLYMLNIGGLVARIEPDGNYTSLTESFAATCTSEGCSGLTEVSDIALSAHELMLLEDRTITCLDLADLTQEHVIDNPVQAPCDALAPDGNGGIYLFSAFPSDYTLTHSCNDSLLYRVSANGELLDSYITRQDNTLSLNNISQASYNRYYLRPQSSDHIFRLLTPDGPQPAYRIDFGTENIPPRYFFDSVNENLGDYLMSPYYKIPMELHETSSHIVFRVAGPSAHEITILYDKESLHGIMWENDPNDMSLQILAADDEWFYTIMPTVPNDTESHGPLFRHLLETLKRDGSNASSAHIVKIAFRRF